MVYGDELENFYAGDIAWFALVELIREDYWQETQIQKDLLKKVENKIDLAIVIYGRVKNDCLDWVDRKIPALENLRPVDCLNNEFRTLRLRECLMRMH
jgi:uncharacterized protein (DUF2384 family)